MALNLPDFLNARPMQADNSALANIFGNYNKGYEVAQMPAQKELERSLMQAQTQKAQQPELSSFAKALQNLQQMKQVAPDAPETKLMEQWAISQAQNQNGTSINYTPDGGFSLQMGGPAGQGQSGNASSYLQVPGQNGATNVVNQPTAKTKQDVQDSLTANFNREQMAPMVVTPYVGATSDLSLSSDLAAYNLTKDPAIFERLVQHVVANQLMPEYASNMMAAQGQKDTVGGREDLEHTLKQGWPRFDKTIKEKFPPKVIEEGHKRHNEFVKKLSQDRANFNLQGQPFKLSEPKPKAEEDRRTTMQKNGQDINKKLTRIRINGRTLDIPLNKVEDFMNKYPEASREQG